MPEDQTAQSTDGIDRTCPNCGKIADDEYDIGDADFREFKCENKNCHCMVFRTDTDRTEDGGQR